MLLEVWSVMPIKVKDAATAAAKFTSRAAGAAADYQAGVPGAGPSWQAGATAASDNYDAGVQAAIGRKAFAAGIQKAGGAKYAAKAGTIGARRFPEGVREAGPDFQAGVALYLATIAALTLSPRRPKGDPANFLRVQQVGEALRRKKVGG